MIINRKQFKAYRQVQESGQTNMLLTTRVANLSKGVLNSEQVTYIIDHYDELAKQYGYIQ